MRLDVELYLAKRTNAYLIWATNFTMDAENVRRLTNPEVENLQKLLVVMTSELDKGVYDTLELTKQAAHNTLSKYGFETGEITINYGPPPQQVIEHLTH